MRNLSKSKLVAFRQCPKRLWLEIHRPELREDSESTQARFQVGYQVGDIARKNYDPNGQGAFIDVQTEGFEVAFNRTAELLVNSHFPIFEAGLRTEGALAFADIMLPVRWKGKRVWRMVEVKAASKVKDYHRDDLAIQTFIARASGIELYSVALAHIDSSWAYPGGNDYSGLLTEADLTEEAFGRTEEIAAWIAAAQEVAAQPLEPKNEVGDHCYSPFECGFFKYCHCGVESVEDPFGMLPNLSAKKRESFEENGIEKLIDVPDEWLSETQQFVKKHTLEGTSYLDLDGASAILKPLGFPAYFLDFETISFGIPIWAGTRPYQQLPFQFSCHILSEDGSLDHQHFLDLSGSDPTRAFAEKLISVCGQTGPVFVYNAGFERNKIEQLAWRYQDLSEQLGAIVERTVDLLPIAREFYYHPSQNGSWSIKAVLPTAIPDLSYDDLDGVQDGWAAMDAYAEATNPETTQERKKEIEQQLFAYCRLDTFAMVRLWQMFMGIPGSPVI